MAIRTELSLRLANSPGALAAVGRALADERVRITAMSLDATGLLRLLLDNHVRGAGVLRDRRHTIAEREVIAVQVSSAPGSLATVLALLADAGVNVEYVYMSTPEAGPMSVAVIGVDDPMRAAGIAGL